MCRNIKSLFNFDPPATDEEIENAALQFVRKLSGMNSPSKINEATFNLAVKKTSQIAQDLIDNLETDSSPRNREEEAEKAHLRAVKRFGLAD